MKYEIKKQLRQENNPNSRRICVLLRFLSLASVILFLLPPTLFAQTPQTRQISGTILGSDGEGLIGAQVVEKATGNGVISATDGRFSIMIPASGNPLLTVSYIGYISQEVSVDGQTDLTITLKEDLQALEDIVVIAYGTAKRENYAGSVGSVRLENTPIALAPNMNALESLKGTVAGLNIGATNTAGGTPSMEVRGQRSISGNNNPLIVVDGVIFLGSLAHINPNDIASFDILKDATSAAAYGSRSANGVIIVTTKKGKQGKPTVSFNASETMQTWQNRPKLMKADEWIESVIARNKFAEGDLSWLTEQETKNMEAGREIDWLKESTRTGLLQDYQVVVSGAGERLNYYLSGGYQDTKTVVKGEDYNRVSLVAKINTDITDWLQIGVDGGFTRMDASANAANLATAKVMSPYGSMYRDEENKLLEKYPYTMSQGNPLWGVYNDEVSDHIDLSHVFRLNSYAVVKIPGVEGLSYRINYNGIYNKRRAASFTYETNYVKEGPVYDLDRYSPETLQSLLSSANGTIHNDITYSWVLDNILAYNRTFGAHALDLTAVATRDRSTYERLTSTGSDFAANGNTSLGLYGLPKATTQKVAMEWNQRSNIGYMARGAYTFDNRYIATATYRRDGASVFGANRKWGDFYSFGAAWRVTNERFMESVDFLDELKVRLSWGMQGNQGLNPYGTLSTMVSSVDGGIRYQMGNSSDILYGLYVGVMGNADLGWETTRKWDGGFESAWLGNRLFVDMDFYYEKTTDQIFTRNIPVVNGFKDIKATMGQIDNRGIELTVRSVNIDGPDFRWTSGLTYSRNRNKLVHLYGLDADGDGKEDDDIGNSRFIGKPLGVIYGYVQDGIVQETDTEYMAANGVPAGYPKYVDLDGNGTIGVEDRDILGYSNPNFRMSLSNTFTYKNIELYMMLTGNFGGGGYYIKANPGAYTIDRGLFNGNSISIPNWTAENKSNVYPSIDFTGDSRFRGDQSRGFVRMQDITLAYSFSNQGWVKRANIKNLRVYFSGKNIFTITNWEGGDPEVGTAVRDSHLPVLTSFTVGANLSF